MIKVSAPARICFFGDHQDYLNLPVIARTINRYIQIEAEPSKENLFFIQLTLCLIQLTLPASRRYKYKKQTLEFNLQYMTRISTQIYV